MHSFSVHTSELLLRTGKKTYSATKADGETYNESKNEIQPSYTKSAEQAAQMNGFSRRLVGREIEDKKNISENKNSFSLDIKCHKRCLWKNIKCLRKGERCLALFPL